MKKFLWVLCVVMMLSGCGSELDPMDRAISLRKALQQRECCFVAVITADYGDKLYTFRMDCRMDAARTLHFTVLEPDTISGISGTVTADGGKIEFTDTLLTFPTIADGQITPVSSPWVVMNTLCSGYIQYCGNDGDGLRICVNDSYREDALTLEIWTNSELMPVCCEILYGGKRIVTVEIREFQLM